MNKEAELIKGLQSAKKYVPFWYRFDQEGMGYYYRWCTTCSFYYFTKAEVDIIKNHVKDMINGSPKPLTLVEMGSGNSPKSRIFIDAILETQTKLEYLPVDIAEDVLYNATAELNDKYGEKLVVKPVAGDYSVGVDALKSITGPKLIIWIGGGFMNQPYTLQVNRLEAIANNMTDADRLIISFDITQDAETVENAYLDPTGLASPLLLNSIWRLNREFGSQIDTAMFDLESKFIHNTDVNGISNVMLRARSKCDQAYEIPGLGLSVHFKEGEYWNLQDGEGDSGKYTLEQIMVMGKKGRQQLLESWTDADKHVSMCCFRKNE